MSSVLSFSNSDLKQNSIWPISIVGCIATMDCRFAFYFEWSLLFGCMPHIHKLCITMPVFALKQTLTLNFPYKMVVRVGCDSKSRFSNENFPYNYYATMACFLSSVLFLSPPRYRVAFLLFKVTFTVNGGHWLV